VEGGCVPGPNRDEGTWRVRRWQLRRVELAKGIDLIFTHGH